MVSVTHHDAIQSGQEPPTAADLEQAVRRESLADVFAILAEWRNVPAMLHSTGKIASQHINTAVQMALRTNRADIVSLLLAASSRDRLPSRQALGMEHIANFQALLYNGWDINEQIGGISGPATLACVFVILLLPETR